MRFLIFTSKIKQIFPNLYKSKHEFTLFIKIKGGTPRVHAFKSRKYVFRAGPQLRVDAYGVRGFTRSLAPAIVYKAKQAENIMFSICEPKN